MDQVGQKKLFSMSRDFGFGSKTGINLNGEVSGKLNHYNEWSAVSLGMIAMGHEVGLNEKQNEAFVYDNSRRPSLCMKGPIP